MGKLLVINDDERALLCASYTDLRIVPKFP